MGLCERPLLDDLGSGVAPRIVGEKQQDIEFHLGQPVFFADRIKLSTTTSSGGLILALQRAITTARPEGRYRKHCYWLRYKAVLLESSLLESSRPKSFVPFALQLWMSVVNH